MKTDILIIGAGPAGIFTALELIRKGYKGHITLVEKGQSVEKRHCPKAETGRCMNCKPYCHITTGFSGAGAFSDGKLSLSHEVGGDLPTLVGAGLAQETIDYADSIYLEFGADTHIEGISDPDKVKDIRRRAIQAGLKLVDCPIRHLGTEKAQKLYHDIQNWLEKAGVEMHFNAECENIIIEDNECHGVLVREGGEGLRARYLCVCDGVVIQVKCTFGKIYIRSYIAGADRSGAAFYADVTAVPTMVKFLCVRQSS